MLRKEKGQEKGTGIGPYREGKSGFCVIHVAVRLSDMSQMFYLLFWL